MKETTVIETHLDYLIQHEWLWYDKEDGDVAPILNDADIAKAAELWKMTPEAVKCIKEAFSYFAEELIEATKEDLKDLYTLI